MNPELNLYVENIKKPPLEPLILLSGVQNALCHNLSRCSSNEERTVVLDSLLSFIYNAKDAIRNQDEDV